MACLEYGSGEEKSDASGMNVVGPGMLGDEMIGASSAFQEVKRMLGCIARCDAYAVIEGETGTGKELVARAIHYESRRRAGPFIPVNCGAIPDTLLEAELFGYRQGAFTDAKRSSPGILQLAHTGTLFLDEVDALSGKAQVALLRFLQERKVRRLGEGVERAVDVRIVAASNRSLEELAHAGRFRIDLYYRLEVMRIKLPALRDRGDDLLLLADYFLQAMAERYGRTVPRLDAESCAWLRLQRWPGNVRELENFIEREFLLAEGEPVLHLSALGRAESSSVPDAAREEWNYRRAKASAVESFDRSFLQGLMRFARGNITVAAHASGKERRDLGRLLRKYAIAPDSFRGATASLR